MAVQVKVAGMAVDSRSNAPIVLLREVEGARAVPIWVGQLEAGAIAAALEGSKPQRPQTHDLMRSALRAAGWRVAKVTVVDLRDSTFYASIEMVRDADESAGNHMTLDARPSDAIALALRSGAPIFIEDAVIRRAGLRPAQEEKDRWDELLENLTEEDFGRYKQ